MPESIAQQTVGILEREPLLSQALRRRIANVSAVAKKIVEENKMGRSRVVAVRAAIRRYLETAEDYDERKDLKRIMKQTEIRLQSGITVLVAHPRLRQLLKLQEVSQKADFFSLIESENAMTIIIDDKHASAAEKMLGRSSIIEKQAGQYSLSLTSPKEIENIPGFAAFITDVLGRKGINIKKYFSCYTDTVFILEKKDAIAALEALEAVKP